MVTHLVLLFWVEIAFSSSSRAPDFFNFLTKLLTAFSDHLSSAMDEPSGHFFQPNRRFTTGGVKGNMPAMSKRSLLLSRHLASAFPKRHAEHNPVLFFTHFNLLNFTNFTCFNFSSRVGMPKTFYFPKFPTEISLDLFSE